jgi:hypothetical protein
VLLDVTPTAGSAFTKTDTVALDVHPELFAPVTENSEVDEGVTVITLPLELFDHVYEDAPNAFNEMELPAHTDEEAA